MTDRQRWSRVDDLFAAVLELPAAQRAGFLDAECGTDTDLRREIDGLLAADEAAGRFLEDPFDPPELTTLGADPDSPTGSLPEEAWSGATIGNYRLIRVLGRGGMGTVYLARRADRSYEAAVAIKRIPPGTAAEGLGRRLVNERRILASLEHPNIARLLDAGTTADGAPYFVMELVEGAPIDRFCDAGAHTVERRLQLFLQVCAAVQHAHQQLVVHRDLKPGNILVGADGSLKLLDFGIAKLLDPGALPHTVALTRTGEEPMTPAYASPEQLRGETVTTATDIYSLGVILYRLLTGKHPGSRQWPGREQDLLPPSVVALSDDGERPGAVERARDRSLQPSQLSRRLQGDLDTIVLKSLAEDLSERYSSVEQLAEDLGRHLSGLPVRARSPTLTYRASKFVRRHRWGVSATILVFSMTIAFSIASAQQATRIAGQSVEIAQQRDRAEEERDRAAVERQRAEQVTAFLVDLFEVSNPGQALGETITARELLRRGAERIEGELPDQPQVKAELMETMGQVYWRLGLYDEAEPLVRDSLELRESTLGPDHPEVADSLISLGDVLVAKGRFDEAEPFYRRAVDLRRTAAPDARAESLANLGLVLQDKGNLAEAEQLLVEALDLRREALGTEHPSYATNLHNLASLYSDQGRLALAADLFDQVLAIDEKTLAPEHPDVSSSLNNLAGVLQEQGRFEEAESLYRRALALRRKAFGADHPEVAKTLNNLGHHFYLMGRFEAATPLFAEALATWKRTSEPGHPLVAFSLDGQARTVLELGRVAEAEELARESLAIRTRVYGPDHPILARSLSHLAIIRDRAGRGAEAERAYLKVLEIRRRSLESDPTNERRVRLANILLVVGRRLAARGETAAARAHFNEARELIEPLAEPSDVLERVALYAELLLRLDHGDRAAPLVARLRTVGWYAPQLYRLAGSQ